MSFVQRQQFRWLRTRAIEAAEGLNWCCEGCRKSFHEGMGHLSDAFESLDPRKPSDPEYKKTLAACLERVKAVAWEVEMWAVARCPGINVFHVGRA